MSVAAVVKALVSDFGELEVLQLHVKKLWIVIATCVELS